MQAYASQPEWMTWLSWAWGRNSIPAMVLKNVRRVFARTVHCHECRMPVTPSRRRVIISGAAHPATREAMNGLCIQIRLMTGDRW